MKPWTVIGWLVLSGLVFMGWRWLHAGYTGPEEYATPTPPSVMKVDNIWCGDEFGRFGGKVTVINEGPSEVEFAQLFLSAGDLKIDATFQPFKIPVGSRATATWSVPDKPNGACTIQAIQDLRGRQLTVTG